MIDRSAFYLDISITKTGNGIIPCPSSYGWRDSHSETMIMLNKGRALSTMFAFWHVHKLLLM